MEDFNFENWNLSGKTTDRTNKKVEERIEEASSRREILETNHSAIFPRYFISIPLFLRLYQ